MRLGSENNVMIRIVAERLALVSALGFLFGFHGLAYPQIPTADMFNFPGLASKFAAQPLTVTTYSTASMDSNVSRLNFVISFVNDELQFVTAKDKQFRADYQVKLVILNPDGSKVDSTSWQGFVTAQNFKETVATDISHTTRSHIDVAPGEYRYRIEFVDLETRRARLREGTVTVRDFSSNTVDLSDIAILDAANLAQSSDAINKEDLVDSLRYAFFEIYNLPVGDSVVVQYEIFEPVKEKALQGQRALLSAGRVTPNFIAIEKPELITNESRLKLTIASEDTTFELERALKFHGQRAFKPEVDLKDAIEKLVYIAKGDELKRLKKTRGEEQRKEFLKFWEKRDPTPNTPDNEYYDEYYRRIEYADRTFGGSDRGWRTDMGMVYIKLGSPDYVDQPLNYNDYFDSFSSRRPRVIWHYLSYNRRVVFLFDAGEYRIANHHEIFDLINDEMRF